MNRIITISVAIIAIAYAIAIFIETLYIAPISVDYIVNRAYEDNSIGYLVERANNNGIRLSIYDSGASLNSSCEQIGFCFDSVLFDRADEVIAFAPRGMPFERARVTKSCEDRFCHKMEQLGIYIERATADLIAKANEARVLKDFGCEIYSANFYSGKYCRQDYYDEGKLVESKIYAYISKPWTYGFLMFDQNYLPVARWRINLLTGKVILDGAAVL